MKASRSRAFFRVLALFLLACLCAAALPGCRKPPKTLGPPLKIARYYWPGTYWIEIAERKGWFKQAGLNVELVDTNPDYFASLDDMAAGRMDVNNFSLFDVLSYDLEGADLVLVINTDMSFGVETIVGFGDARDLRSLKGKRVGVSLGTYMEYILDAALAREELSEMEVTKIDLRVEDAVERVETDRLDAVVTWEPITSQLLSKRGGVKLFDTSEIHGLLPNGTVFHRSFIEARERDVRAVVEVWRRAAAFMKEHPGEAYRFIAEIYNVTAAEVEALARSDRILDMQDNLVAFSYSTGFESLYGSARKMLDFMQKGRSEAAPLDITTLIDGRFIRAASREAE